MSPIIINDSTESGRTLKSMRDEVISNSFDPTTYNGLVTGWLNEAQVRVFQRIGLPQNEATEILTTTSGTASYEVPDDMLVLVTVEDSRGELAAVARDAIPTTARSGSPTAYALYGTNLILYPTPNAEADLTLRYRSRPAPMVNDDDVSMVPGELAYLLVTYALSRAYRKEDDFQAASFYWQEWERDLRDMRASSQTRESSRVRRISGSWGMGASSPRFLRP